MIRQRQVETALRNKPALAGLQTAIRQQFPQCALQRGCLYAGARRTGRCRSCNAGGVGPARSVTRQVTVRLGRRPVMEPLWIIAQFRRTRQVCPPRVSWEAGATASSKRSSSISTTCAALVRPKRASQPWGSGSLLWIVPVASLSSRYAPE